MSPQLHCPRFTMNKVQILFGFVVSEPGEMQSGTNVIKRPLSASASFSGDTDLRLLTDGRNRCVCADRYPSGHPGTVLDSTTSEEHGPHCQAKFGPEEIVDEEVD